MSLNAVIKNRGFNGRGRGQDRGRSYGLGGNFVGRGVGILRNGPLRVNNRSSSFKVAKSFSRTKDLIWRHDLFEDSLAAEGLTGAKGGTKLYISNLDYGVSNEDIKELFSGVGDLKWCAVHYDRNGRPSGTAEAIYARRSDAIAAVKRYNNVNLDGKPMKIEIIGNDLGLPVSPRINVVGGADGRGKRTVVMTPKLGQVAAGSFMQVSGWNRGGGTQRGRGRGQHQSAGTVRGGLSRVRRGLGRGRQLGRQLGRGPIKKTAEDLDKELETYHAKATNTSW